MNESPTPCVPTAIARPTLSERLVSSMLEHKLDIQGVTDVWMSSTSTSDVAQGTIRVAPRLSSFLSKVLVRHPPVNIQYSDAMRDIPEGV